MKLTIFSDPHLGVSRQANTTRESSQKLNNEIYSRTVANIKGNTYIAGDLFDKTYNPERVTMQGIKVAKSATVLSGNHDETNRSDTTSSLDIVSIATGNVIESPNISKPYFHENDGVYSVPHHVTQELFIEALDSAMEWAKSQETPHHKYLFVHCNRGELPGEKSDSTLLINWEKEEELLTVFDRVFYGHIHTPNIKEEGEITQKAVVLGNVFPTSYSDISDKYVFSLDTKTNFLTAERTWDSRKGYMKVDIKSLQGPPIGAKEEVKFFDLIGQDTRRQAAEAVKTLWDANPQALAVRSSVQYPEQKGVEVESIDVSDLSTTIKKELENSPLLPLFEKLESIVKENHQ